MDIAQAISCTHTTIHVLPEATPMIDPKKVSPTHHLNPVRQLGASHSFVAEIFAYDRSAAAILCSELEKQTKGIPVSIWKELRTVVPMRFRYATDSPLRLTTLQTFPEALV